MKKFSFKNLESTNEKITQKDVNRATENNKNNDFLMEVAKKLVDN